MNGSDILNALDNLSKTSCRNSKSVKLAAHLADPMFALVSRLTCDPFVTFGVKAPLAPSSGFREITGTEDSNFSLLRALQHRELTGTMARAALNAAHIEMTCASGELLRRILSRNLVVARVPQL